MNFNSIKYFLSVIVPMQLLTGAVSAQQHITLSVYNGQAEIKAPESVTLTDGFHMKATSSNSLRIFTSFSFKNNALLNATPTLGEAYTSIRVFKVPGVNENNIDETRYVSDENRTIQYYDGLGRVKQSVSAKASPGFADIVQPLRYNEQGKITKQYLPYTIQNNNGAYVLNALYPNLGLEAFYTTPPSGVAVVPNPYLGSSYENDVRSRVLQQVNAGGDISHPSIRKAYKTNNEITNIQDAEYRRVKYYTVGTGQTPTLTDMGWYAANELAVDIVKDANWVETDGKVGTAESYTDKQGKVILKRSWLDANTVLSTYYVYDKFGNLNFVLPPKAEPDVDNGITQTMLNELCYQYTYDPQHRLKTKKLPGVGAVHYVYNKLDQLVMSQDANQRNKTPQEWSFVKYDELGRSIMTGIYQHDGSIAVTDKNSEDETVRIAMQNLYNAQTHLWEKRNSTGTHGYSSDALPTDHILSYLTINYYDNYNIPALPATYNQASAYSLHTDGLLTASKVAILNDPSKMLWSVNYYDDKANIKKGYSQLLKAGLVNESNYDELEYSYSFSGELIATERKHHLGNSLTTILNRYEYDHVGRNLAIFQRVNNQEEIVLNKFDYNEIGQLISSSQHSVNGQSFLNQSGHTYNQQGNLISNESPLFKYRLKYGDGADPQYNGNISAVEWGNTFNKSSSYQYDKLNRLTAGTSQSMTENNISYDKAGNITGLTRDGQNISYQYANGGLSLNQLQTVSGNGLNQATYVYDLNGNTLVDGSKTNINFTYNLLNLPQQISGNVNITYTYDASGKMWSKQSNTTGFTEYLNGIQYTNGNLDFIKNEKGRAIRQSNNTFLYHYDLTDHLGNVRLTFDKDPNTNLARTLQQDDYYPFGKRRIITPSSSDNKYLYNGKDIQDELGQYDYGARFYDPEIARWNAQDPLAEQYLNTSPYAYVLNNPIGYTDPDGMQANPFIMPSNPKAGWQFSWVWWPDDQPIPDGWKEVTVNAGLLDKVTIKGQRPSWARNRDQAYREVLEKTKENYKEGVGGLFAGYPDNLVDKASSAFYEKYLAHNEIDPFSKRPRVIGLGDANWIIDIAASMGTSAILRGVAARTIATEGYINLASAERTAHIIAGDATGGGHAWFGSLKSFTNGLTGSKSMFPASWSNSKIMNAVSDVAVNNEWVQQTGKVGAMLTKSGQPVRFVVEGAFQGTKIRVITTYTDIITAFPIK